MPFLFEAPVGPEDERNAGIIWPIEWWDANPYNLKKKYEVGKGSGRWAYHTGADLNFKDGVDNNQPVYAMGDGTVTYAQIYPTKGVWGGLIIICHGVIDFMENGVRVKKMVYSRYAHVQGISQAITEKKEATVVKGQPIARIGGADLGFDPHLHFDISTTGKLERDPGFWPGGNADLVREHFVDPMVWLYNQIHHQPASNPTPTDNTNTELRYAIQPEGVQVRKDHSTSADIVHELKPGEKLSIKKTGGVNDHVYMWAQISGGDFDGNWVPVCTSDQSLIYLSKRPPA